MKATYRIRANELDEKFIERLKTTFGEQEIEIVVCDIDETEYLLPKYRTKNVGSREKSEN
jgi:antitoxin YefM